MFKQACAAFTFVIFLLLVTRFISGQGAPMTKLEIVSMAVCGCRSGVSQKDVTLWCCVLKLKGRHGIKLTLH